ncbi:MAG: putative transcriptional regulator, MerR family [Marmoricola sp.]|jgi:chaperone modulatory protein CbpM|nr:putative transcriptional regulator, MerR family [Marmoricola sp.]
MKATTTYALARPSRLGLDTYARLTGVHPELIRRLVSLGLLEATRDAGGDLWFETIEVRAMSRVQRLRQGLNLNYAAIGVVIDLLDRIEQLERMHRHRQAGEDRWT